MVPEVETPRTTFLGLPPDPSSLERARFVVLPIPYESSTSHLKGTREGPQAIISASRHLELYDEELGLETYKAGIHTLTPPAILGDPASFVTSVANLVEPLARMGKVVVALGGEHSVAEGPLVGLVRARRKVSLLHLGAHADLRDTYLGRRHSHACAVRRMADHADRVVQVGVRSLSKGEAEYLAEHPRHFCFLRHEHRDLRELLPKVLSNLADDVYLSLDLSVFDPSVVPGVGSPQPGGLSWAETMDLVRAVANAKEIRGATVSELTPLGDGVTSEMAAAKAVYRLMGCLYRKAIHADELARTRSTRRTARTKARR